MLGTVWREVNAKGGVIYGGTLKAPHPRLSAPFPSQLMWHFAVQRVRGSGRAKRAAGGGRRRAGERKFDERRAGERRAGGEWQWAGERGGANFNS